MEYLSGYKRNIDKGNDMREPRGENKNHQLSIDRKIQAIFRGPHIVDDSRNRHDRYASEAKEAPSKECHVSQPEAYEGF